MIGPSSPTSSKDLIPYFCSLSFSYTFLDYVCVYIKKPQGFLLFYPVFSKLIRHRSHDLSICSFVPKFFRFTIDPIPLDVIYHFDVFCSVSIVEFSLGPFFTWKVPYCLVFD